MDACCRDFAEAYGVFIIDNPEWEPDYDPTPPEGTSRDQLPTAYDEPPSAGRRYALSDGKTYMPMTRCPFCGKSHARYSRRYQARF
ncbi:MAG: hypothetical protein C7B45_03505 [Sulfobacillus acidophilus]|uniref:Uncharacterized protein n=1 Tax=Sulfobacillus acidophilus TaxID=53633 RepID=A0A2T2WMD3_9FIRM|nr:MAG: hypothetical protein C7B45_03505 [Sulfobacillus acidophilus]